MFRTQSDSVGVTNLSVGARYAKISWLEPCQKILQNRICMRSFLPSCHAKFHSGMSILTHNHVGVRLSVILHNKTSCRILRWAPDKKNYHTHIHWSVKVIHWSKFYILNFVAKDVNFTCFITVKTIHLTWLDRPG